MLTLNVLLKSSTNCNKFQEKSCDQIHDVILWPLLSRRILNVSAKIFLNSIYKRDTTSCSCPDVSDFKPKGVKMFLLYICLEYQI